MYDYPKQKELLEILKKYVTFKLKLMQEKGRIHRSLKESLEEY